MHCVLAIGLLAEVAPAARKSAEYGVHVGDVAFWLCHYPQVGGQRVWPVCHTLGWREALDGWLVGCHFANEQVPGGNSGRGVERPAACRAPGVFMWSACACHERPRTGQACAPAPACHQPFLTTTSLLEPVGFFLTRGTLHDGRPTSQAVLAFVCSAAELLADHGPRALPDAAWQRSALEFVLGMRGLGASAQGLGSVLDRLRR